MSPENFSILVGAIYDCALDPGKWPETLRLLVETVDGVAGVLGTHGARVASSAYQVGFDEAHLELYNRVYARINPTALGVFLTPVGEVYTSGALCDEAELLESRFYNEWCKPAGLIDMMGVKPLHTDVSAHLTLFRDDRKPRFGEAETNCFRLVAPHICRTLTISDALQMRALVADSLDSTLNGLAAGVFMANHDRRLIHANIAGQKMLKDGAIIRLVDKKLTPTDASAQAALAAALASLAPGARPEAAEAATIALPGKRGGGFIATILPISQGQRGGVLAPFDAAAAIFVQSPAQAPPRPGAAFAKLHGLTASELRVLLALAPGLGVPEAADMLGIGEQTVRAHLKQIFAKTGVRKQAELVALLMASMPPTAPAAR